MHWDAYSISASYLRCTSLIHRNVCLKNQLTNIISRLYSNRSLVHCRPKSGWAEQGLQRPYRRAGASHRQTQTQVWKLKLNAKDLTVCPVIKVSRAWPSFMYFIKTDNSCRVFHHYWENSSILWLLKVSWLCFTCIFGPMRHSGTYLMCNIEVFFHGVCNSDFFLLLFWSKNNTPQGLGFEYQRLSALLIPADIFVDYMEKVIF